MRRRSRTRRIVKWLARATAGLLGGIWLWSGWYAVGYSQDTYSFPSWEVWLAHGCVTYTRYTVYDVTGPERWGLESVGVPGLSLSLPSVHRHAKMGHIWTTYTVPIWPLIALVAILSGLLWRRDRPPPIGYCPKCGYNLTGNVSGRCPECGALVKREGEQA